MTVVHDTIFSTGLEQAANNVGLRFGTGLILGLAVGDLRQRFRSRRVSLAQTALPVYPRRLAICAALRPAAQSLSSSATSSASQPIGDAIRRLPTTAGSLAAAADVLGGSRSALSHRLADLERQLGVALVQKHGHDQPRPTPCTVKDVQAPCVRGCWTTRPSLPLGLNGPRSALPLCEHARRCI
jgi:Bacterial regulatory helix-turn-helix protein, lysR family